MTARETDTPSPAARPAPRPPLGRGATIVALGAGVALVVLTVLVATGGTARVDEWAKSFFRPREEWGRLQVQVDVLVEGLRPRNSAALLILGTVLVAARRRSWWPVACAAVVGATGTALTLGLKAAVGRVDTHGEVGPTGGSFPSGHVVVLLMAAGCLALLLRQRPGRMAWFLVGLAAGTMAWALLVQTAHWLTDVVGALLIGVLVLSVAQGLPFTHAGRSPAAGP